MTKGRGTQVPKALLISCRAERLTVWARNYKVDSCQLNDACGINLSNILGDLMKQSARLNDHSEGWGEAIRVVVDKLLKSCQRNLSDSGVFVAKVKLCKEAAATHEGSNDMHACATAEAQVSYCIGGVTEIKLIRLNVYKGGQLSCLCQVGKASLRDCGGAILC